MSETQTPNLAPRIKQPRQPLLMKSFFEEIVRTELYLIRLEEAEWFTVIDGLNGLPLDVVPVWNAFGDLALRQSLGRKWGVRQFALFTKLDALSFAGKVAIVQLVECFWRGVTDLGMDQHQALKWALSVMR